jgi:hypothetical protein
MYIYIYIYIYIFILIEIGFKKMRLPEELFLEIKRFYEDNKDDSKLEEWFRYI